MLRIEILLFHGGLTYDQEAGCVLGLSYQSGLGS